MVRIYLILLLVFNWVFITVFARIKHVISRRCTFTFMDHNFHFLEPETMKLHINSSISSNYDTLPSSLLHLEIYGDSIKVGKVNFPNKLISLSTKNLNFDLDCLPPTLKSLRLSDTNKLATYLPPSLTCLKFGCLFNQPVDCLPPSLIDLEFGTLFNQPVNHLPHSLTRLKFSHYFNQTVDLLPPNIITIEFGFCFDQSISSLPSSIKELTLTSEFSHPLHFPPNVTSLNFLSHFSSPIPFFPPSVTHLVLNIILKHQLPNLPSNLTHLALVGSLFFHQIDASKTKLRVLYSQNSAFRLISFPPCFEMLLACGTDYYKAIEILHPSIHVQQLDYNIYGSISCFHVSLF